MRKNRLITLCIRKIKNNLRRFLTLAVLSCLGVLVFVGIKMSKPDMIESLDTYYKSHNVYDLKIISTLGLTEDDVDSISKLDSRLKVYGSHSKDMQFYTETKSAVIKVMELTNDINTIIVQEGRLPQNNNEVVIEKGISTRLGLKIGDKISLDVPEDDNTVNSKELILVGIVTSPIYVLNSNGNINRGNTNLGTGDVNYYGLVTPDFFNMNYYTEIYISSENNYITNSDEYKNEIDKLINRINEIKLEREKARREDFVKIALEELEKSENEGLEQFAEIKGQLDEAGAELENGRIELEQSEAQLNNAKIELNAAKNEIDDGHEQIKFGEEQLGKAKDKLDSYKNEIENVVSNYGLSFDDVCLIIDAVNEENLPRDTVINLIPQNFEYYDSMVYIVNYLYDNGCESSLKYFLSGLRKDVLISLIPKDIEEYDKIVNFINNYDVSKTRRIIISTLLSEDFIEVIKSSIPKCIINYDKVIAALDDYANLAGKIVDLYNGVYSLRNEISLYDEQNSLLENSKIQIEEAEAKYSDALGQYNYGLQQYNNGKRIHNESLNIYNSHIEEYDLNYNKFIEEIKNARNNINSIDKANWFIYNRLDNTDYASYIDSSESVERLSIIFPIIFFIVAIFISSLSMARMTIEDRAEIGTLKSLGYDNMSIRMGYVLYASIATLIGGIVGSIAGFFYLPKVVFNTYEMMYEVPIFAYSPNLIPILLGLFISLLCICGATIITINSLVKEKTTNLLRPQSPNKGKKILLENIDFIWKKLKFSNKITIRNIFRYKKRVTMIIIGIVGCTTLLLSGYAIRDSIVSIGKKHYGEIFVFDDMLYLDGKLDENELNNTINNSHIKEKVYAKLSTVEVGTDSVNLFVPQNSEEMETIVKLRDADTKSKLSIEQDKVIVSSKLAKKLKLKINDRIEFNDSENNNYSFVVSGITENFVGNYIYMDRITYENRIGIFNINICYIQLDDISNEESVTKDLLQNNSNILSNVSVKSVLERFNKIFGALDSVVVILVVLSGALSFVVLYNLVYISISERQREIATLKVLGFNHKEVDFYIIKEEIIISIIGILIGLLIGTWFGNIIVETIEINTVQFVKQILLKSYILTGGFMMLFNIIVNIRVHFTLKKIDMIESLKSVE